MLSSSDDYLRGYIAFVLLIYKRFGFSSDSSGSFLHDFFDLIVFLGMIHPSIKANMTRMNNNSLLCLHIVCNRTLIKARLRRQELHT